MRKLFFSSCFCLSLTPLWAQDIIGDTIQVFDKAETSILFPKDIDIRDIQFSDQQGFSARIKPANKIIVTANTDAGICGMSLSEMKRGTRKKVRRHYFLLVHRKGPCNRPADLYHDLSSVEKIKSRMKYIHVYRGGQMPRQTSDTDPEINSQQHNVTPVINKSVTVIGEQADADTTMISLGGDLRISKQEFREKAALKTRHLGNFLVFLCNKANSAEACSEVMESALNLFVDENVLVEVSSKTSGQTAPKKIRSYLKDMATLRYSKVELSWSNVQYVGKLEPQPDGTLRGFVEFEQRFSGYLDKMIVYSDVTRKRVEVVLTLKKVKSGGNDHLLWDVLLSDIGVVSTN